MPKKKVAKKLKKGGKAKGKKDKKGKKVGEKVDKEQVYKEAVSQCKIWEHRVTAVELSRQEYREHAHKLLRENESLHQAMRGTERDTIEVIAFLKREAAQKDDMVSDLQEEQKRVKRDLRREKEDLLSQHRDNILLLNEAISAREREVGGMQTELRQVKEFRKMRGQMQEELESSKGAQQQLETACRESMRRTEQKCFEEKLRMHQETTRKMSELAERAHEEAKLNLDKTTVSIFKENVRLSEALSLHMQEGERLKKKERRLAEETAKLRVDRELDQARLKENALVSEQQRQQATERDSKLSSLALQLASSERTRAEQTRVALRGREEARKGDCLQLELLERSLRLKSKELSQVKQAARHVLAQRSDIETFFLDALSFVRRQAGGERSRRAAADRFPPIAASSSSLADQSIIAAGQREAADVSELSWEQREQVLRMLFAQMNGKRVFSKRQTRMQGDKLKKIERTLSSDELCSDTLADSEHSSKAFITQSSAQDVSVDSL